MFADIKYSKLQKNQFLNKAIPQFNYLFNGFPYPILNVTNCAYPLKKGNELIDFCIKSIKYSAIYKYTYIKDLIILVAMGFLTKSL